MVAPLTAAEIREANSVWLPDFIRYVDGWEKRSNGNRWIDYVGHGVHHTGDNARDDISLHMLVNGRADLPGPLCTEAIGDAGTVWQVAIGPANHFGGGDPDVLKAVRAESYGDYPPKTNEYHGSPGSIGGNSYFTGSETMYGNDAEPKPSSIQYRSMVVVAASRIWAADKKDKANDWTAKSTIGHKEWSIHKPDPRSVDMAVFRRHVQRCLDAGPEATRLWHKSGEWEQEMTPEEIYNAVWRTDGMMEATTPSETNPKWWPENVIEKMAKHSLMAAKGVAENNTLLRTLIAQGGGETLSLAEQERIFREEIQKMVAAGVVVSPAKDGAQP